MNTLHEWIKERRRALGFTQAQIAGKLGIHQAQVSGLETGRFKPDSILMSKINDTFGKFSGIYVPMTVENTNKKTMPDKAREALKAYHEAKENNFYLQLDKTTYITADRNQYILHQGTNLSYFTQLTSLLKHMMASHIRTSAVSSVEQILAKIDEIYSLIDNKFGFYDPANILVEEKEEGMSK